MKKKMKKILIAKILKKWKKIHSVSIFLHRQETKMKTNLAAKKITKIQEKPTTKTYLLRAELIKEKTTSLAMMKRKAKVKQAAKIKQPAQQQNTRTMPQVRILTSCQYHTKDNNNNNNSDYSKDTMGHLHRTSTKLQEKHSQAQPIKISLRLTMYMRGIHHK